MPQLGDVTVFGTVLPSVPLKLDTPPRAHPTLDWITVVRAAMQMAAVAQASSKPSVDSRRSASAD
jgi:hypothetical protein